MSDLQDIRASNLQSSSVDSFDSDSAHSIHLIDDDKIQTKMDNLLQDPILRPLLDDLCQWLAKILSIDIHAANFTIPLQTGSDLCCLAEAISKKAEESGMKCPTLVFKKGAKAGSFQARCNMEAFVRWAKALGVRETCLFETVDLVELKFLRNVLICLLEVSKLADKYGVEPPELVKLEQRTKIAWQDLIKLSMNRKETGQVMSVEDISDTVNELQKMAEKPQVHSATDGHMAIARSASVLKKWREFVKKKAAVEVVEISEDNISDESIIVEEEYVISVESIPPPQDDTSQDEQLDLPESDSDDLDQPHLSMTLGTFEPIRSQVQMDLKADIRNKIILQSDDLAELDEDIWVVEEDIGEVESSAHIEIIVSEEHVSKDKDEMVPAAEGDEIGEDKQSPVQSPDLIESPDPVPTPNPVTEPSVETSSAIDSTTDSQRDLIPRPKQGTHIVIPSLPGDTAQILEHTDVGWSMALCFPAVRVNNDGSSLSETQLEMLELKRLKILLLGFILVLIGASLAIICGVFGLQTTSVVEFQSGNEEEVEETTGNGLPAPWFYSLLILSLVFIILGLSLITIWVCQTIKIRQLRNRTFVEKGASYGTLS